MEFDKDGGAIEISKEEYDQHKNNLISLQSICQISSGCSDTETSSNWMRLTTTISKISNTSPQEYLIKHEFNWLKKPNYTYTDAVGVAQHTSLSPVQNSELLTYDTDEYISTNLVIGLGPWNYNRKVSSNLYSANKKTGGMGFEVKLRSDGYTTNPTKQYSYENHRGTLLYRAVRNNSTYSTGDLSGHYIHTKTSYSGSLGIDIKGTGSFTISANVSKDPAIETGVTWQY